MNDYMGRRPPNIVPAADAQYRFEVQNRQAQDVICRVIDTLDSQLKDVRGNVNPIYDLVKRVKLEARDIYGPDNNAIKSLNWLYDGDKLSEDVAVLTNRILRIKQQCGHPLL